MKTKFETTGYNLSVIARKETPTLHTEGCQRAFRAFLGRKVGAIGYFFWQPSISFFWQPPVKQLT